MKNHKQVLILANDSVGLYLFRSELIKKLTQKNTVIASTPITGMKEELENCNCRVINTSIDRRGMNPLKDIRLFIFYLKLLHKEKPNMVLTYTIKPNIYGGLACRLLNIPYAVNITGLGTAFENRGMLRRIVIIMNKVGYKKAKIVFFENEENRQLFIKENIVEENRTYTLNGAGVNLEKYKVSEYPQGDVIKFLFMGRVMAEKGIDELFTAMRKLIKEGIRCELDILGSYEENYEDKIRMYEKEGWLHYYGYQKDVRPFIEKCHCFVLPSWHEGMANTNLESAAMGRPIITSNIHGCLEAVDNESSGYLVEKKNSMDLYKAMKKFIDLSYEEKKMMGLAGRQRMEQMFDKKMIVAETINKLKF